MYQLQAEVEIAASPERVWQVLTDFARYPEWAGWKGTISGEAREGAWLKVVARPRRGKLKLTLYRILRCEPQQELRWHAIYGPFWSLYGQRYWLLQPLAGKRTRVIFGEAYFGWLMIFLRGMIARRGPEQYEQLARRLKEYCESNV
jgi:hypothetical protein